MTDLVMYHRDSCENAKEFIVMSPYIRPHPIISQIMNVNLKHERKPET